jgi:WD40 repeat protein
MAETTDAAADDAVPEPDLSKVRTRAELGVVLERLRAHSGRSLREIANEISADSSSTPIGFSALGDWFRGDRLPLPSRYGVFRRVLHLLGVSNPEPFIAALVRVRDAPARHTGSGELAPYLGLKAFGQDDAHRFFGRDDLVDRALARFREVTVETGQARILWIVGASGAGKSSLLHAGLCPQLTGPGLACLSMTPGSEPVTRLAVLLAPLLGMDVEDCATRLRDDRHDRDGALGWPPVVGDDGEADRSLQVLVVDQFEELLRECDEAEQRAFVRAVTALTAPASPLPCVMVASLRSDFFSEVTAHGELVGSLQDAQIVVTPLDRAQLTDVIVEPARQVGISVDRSLVDLLLRDFIPSGSIKGLHDPGTLPLLAHALLETWKHARRGRMTVDNYAQSGGIMRAIEESAERIHAELSEADRAQLRQIFIRLVHVEEDGVATRRPLSYGELDGLDHLDGDDDPAAPGPGSTTRSPVTDIVDRFVENRLLTAHETTLEIAHESLLTAWPRLGAWIEEDRDALRAHQRVTDATRQWIDAGRDPEQLAGGARLETMRSGVAVATSTLRLTADEQDFLTRSQARAIAAEDARRRQTRRLRVLAAAAAAFALLAGGLAAVTDDARDDAVHARDEALSRQIALDVRALRATDPGLAAQLAVVAYRIAPTSEARSAVIDSSIVPAGPRYLGGPGSTAIALSAEGDLAAVTDSAERAVQLYTVAGGGFRRRGLVGLGDPGFEVYAAALSPDGRTLAAGDSNAEITLWDVADPDRPRRLGEPLRGPDGPIQTLAISPDGRELAAVGAGDGAFRWDVSDPGSPQALPLLPDSSTTWGVAYDPRGEQVAVSDETGHVQLWDISGRPAREHSLRIGDRAVFDVTFSPNGETLVAGSKSGALVAWDLSSSGRPTRLDLPGSTFDSWVNSTAFSPDGTFLAAGSSDLHVKIWDTSTWTPVLTLPHPAALTQVAFLNDSQTFVTADNDGTTRLWDIPSSLRPTTIGPVWNVVVRPDGTRLATFSGEESRMWDTDQLAGPSLTQLGSPEGTDERITGAGDLSSDGRYMALGASLGSVYLVDVSDPARPELVGEPLAGSEALIETVAFSPDGRLLAAGGRDTDTQVWDVSRPEAPELVTVLDDPTEIVLQLSWSPTADLLAAASADNGVYLYDLRQDGEPRLLSRLDGFESEVYTTAFSPDGQVLAAAGTDTSVLLWDVSTPSPPERIGDPVTGPAARIYDLAFDEGGDRLAAAVGDGTTWVWDTRDLGAPDRTAVLGPAPGGIYTTSFTPAGDTLVSSGADGELLVWDMDVEAVIRHICATAGDPITEKEWRVYLRTASYAPPCPQ